MFVTRIMSKVSLLLKIFIAVIVLCLLILIFVSWHGLIYRSQSLRENQYDDRQLPHVNHPVMINGTWQLPSNTSKWSLSSNAVVWSFMRIPKILHQTFSTEMVYENYLPFINSCLIQNPDWVYYLWRDSDAKAFLASKYPAFLAKYYSYKDNLERADSIRYILLHHFGGIYIDMDVECKRPFFPALSKLPAFIDQERTEQTNIIWSLPYSAMNSAMGSAARHPFFKLMIDAMSSYPEVGHAINSTGPLLLTQKYREYASAAGPVGSISLPPVALLEAKVMSPLMDLKTKWKQRCRPAFNSRNWSIPLVGCRTLQAKGWRLDDSDNTTLAVHRFLHLGYKYFAKNRKRKVNLTRVFPHRIKFFGQTT